MVTKNPFYTFSLQICFHDGWLYCDSLQLPKTSIKKAFVGRIFVQVKICYYKGRENFVIEWFFYSVSFLPKYFLRKKTTLLLLLIYQPRRWLLKLQWQSYWKVILFYISGNWKKRLLNSFKEIEMFCKQHGFKASISNINKLKPFALENIFCIYR